MGRSKKPEPSTSIVAERLAWLQHKTVEVRLHQYDQKPQEVIFEATYRDVYPVGSAYFFLFEQAGLLRLVATTAIREIIPIADEDR